ncbi:hypothetical protein ASZ78_006657 [Callipepla squamata]|uniref:EGF-like domain-containing protein n=1 Tax=Callipepla squamata TaxID=9009 RepID=A0A226NEN1_CALSU|nr:hypothetical protein ASZ78_006657 [Callipepla squamata]
MAFGMLIYILLKATLSFSVSVSICLHYTAMGALSEESALTVSSLSTELWNSWTKNNTEADYVEQPRLLKLMQTCLEEHHSYCINGLCAFHSELRKPICKCLAGYNGERCEHLTLNSYAHNSYERYIAVGIGIGILTSGILAIIYCYVRKRYGEIRNLMQEIEISLQSLHGRDSAVKPWHRDAYHPHGKGQNCELQDKHEHDEESELSLAKTLSLMDL